MVSVMQRVVFFILVTLHCASGAASLHCRKAEFKCHDGEECIPGSYHCDGVPDCDDGSDESPSECGPYFCGDGRHRCDMDGAPGCLFGYKVCDGVEDCTDGSDEKNCGNVSTCAVNAFRCSDGSKCIPMRSRCDSALPLCKDKSDWADCNFPTPTPCFEGHLSCDSGRCVRGLLFCNGRKDCDDGSDEKDCGYEDSDIFFLNEGPNIYMNKMTKAGLDFTHLLPISVRMKRTGVHNGMKITGLAFDVKNQNLFISDAREHSIIAVNVTSLDWWYLANESIAFPADVAFDYTSNNVYWVDSVRGTVEVVSVGTLRRTVIVTDLSNPVSLALSPNTGTMFIATTGFETSVFMCGMDGSNRRVLDSSWQIMDPVGSSWLPASLAVHPTKTLLFWTDPGEGTISYVNYSSTSVPKTIKKKIDGVMAVTVTERDIYFTSGEQLTSERANRIKIPGYEKDEGWKSITYGVKPPSDISGKSECLIENGGCDYICLTSEVGKSCACPPEKTLGEDGKSCLD